jgi:DeoR family transcriptional regulator of aga operon
LGRHAFAQVGPIDRVGTLVTDAAADPAVVAAFEAAGVRVILA